MFFYGYLHELAGSRAGLNHSGHLRWSRFLRNPDVDIFCSPIAYFDRQPGGTGHFMVPVDSLAAHGKLWFNEDDTRTFVTPEDAGYGRCPTLWESQGVHQRNFAQIFPRRMGCWYMDLGNEGWVNHPSLWSNISKMREVWQKHANEPVRFAPEIAVVMDETSPLYTTSRSPVTPALVSHLRASLTRIGAPVGWWLLEDFLAGKVEPAKLYIFPNAFVLTAEQRARAKQVLADQGATAVWFYAPGFLDPEAGLADPAFIRDLTGIGVRLLDEPLQDLLSPIAEAPLCMGVSEPFGSKQEALKTQFAVAENEGLEPLARYATGDGPVGAAVTKQDGRPSVYIASLYAPSALLRNLARRAGVWIWCDSDDVVLGDARPDGGGWFLALSASAEGDKVIRMPRPTVVRDVFTGQVLGRGAEIRMDLRQGETRLLRLEDVR